MDIKNQAPMQEVKRESNLISTLHHLQVVTN